MLHLAWIGVPTLLSIFVLPLLSRNRIYRAATLFAGLNVWIVTTALLLEDLSSVDGIDEEALAFYLTHTLPMSYIASLITGAIIIPKRIVSASTGLRKLLLSFYATLSYLLLIYIFYFRRIFAHAYHSEDQHRLSDLLGMLAEATVSYLSQGYAMIVVITAALVSAFATIVISQPPDLPRNTKVDTANG